MVSQFCILAWGYFDIMAFWLCQTVVQTSQDVVESYGTVFVSSQTVAKGLTTTHVTVRVQRIVALQTRCLSLDPLSLGPISLGHVFFEGWLVCMF